MYEITLERSPGGFEIGFWHISVSSSDLSVYLTFNVFLCIDWWIISGQIAWIGLALERSPGGFRARIHHIPATGFRYIESNVYNYCNVLVSSSLGRAGLPKEPLPNPCPQSLSETQSLHKSTLLDYVARRRPLSSSSEESCSGAPCSDWPGNVVEGS